MPFGERYAAFDRFQQRHASVGFPLAVLQKYSDDQAGYLAATITYYGFFSLFPLLLVLTTSLGFVLRGHHHLQQSIVNSALGQFPVIGRELQRGSLHGSSLALGLGVAAALWAGMGVFLASENAMNQLWGVPARLGRTSAWCGNSVRSCSRRGSTSACSGWAFACSLRAT